MTTPDELPNADTVLDASDILQYGTLALSHILTDRWSPYHDIAGIVYQADDFMRFHTTLLWGAGNLCLMDELLDCLLDVELYSLPNISKERKPRGPGMKEDRVTFGYGTSTKASHNFHTHQKQITLTLFQPKKKIQHGTHIERRLRFLPCANGGVDGR
jgi:hypothetical protein